jgi:hypothetical protein
MLLIPAGSGHLFSQAGLKVGEYFSGKSVYAAVYARKIMASSTSYDVKVGDTVSFKITAAMSDGAQVEVTSDEKTGYLVGDPSIVTVDKSGKLMAGKKSGKTTIYVTYNGKQAIFNVVVTEDSNNGVGQPTPTVTPKPTVKPTPRITPRPRPTPRPRSTPRPTPSPTPTPQPVLTSLTSSVKSIDIVQNINKFRGEGERKSYPVVIKGVYKTSTGSETKTINSQVKFTTSNSKVASMFFDSIRTGDVPGSAVITYSYGGFQGTIPVKVQAYFKELKTSSDTYTIKLASSRGRNYTPIVVSAVKYDGTSENVTSYCRITSSDNSVAYFSLNRLQGLKVGSATLTIKYAGMEKKVKVNVTQ